MRSNTGTKLRLISERCSHMDQVTCMDQLTCCHFGSTKGLKVFLQQQKFRKNSIVMSMEQQLRDLAQTHLEHIQDFRWSDLRRAVVLHLGSTCAATWHPEFVQVLEDGVSKWIWIPRQIICRTHQRALGLRHPDGRFTCTDPNCLRPHAPNWHLIAVSLRTAHLTLATMPYVDEEYYHQYRWHSPIPQPEAYGQMMVTATSRRANLNEQPRR